MQASFQSGQPGMPLQNGFAQNNGAPQNNNNNMGMQGGNNNGPRPPRDPSKTVCRWIKEPNGCTNPKCQYIHPPGSNARVLQNNQGGGAQMQQQQQQMGQNPQMPGQGGQQFQNNVQNFQNHQPNQQTGQGNSGQKPLCKHGLNCNNFKLGKCKFYHPPQNQMQGGQQQMPGQQNRQVQMNPGYQQNNPQQNHGNGGQHQHKGTHHGGGGGGGLCFQIRDKNGCDRVHCKHKHMIGNLDVNLKNECILNPSHTNEHVRCCSLLNNDTQLIVVLQSVALLYELPSLKNISTFNLQFPCDYVAAFNQIPNTLFFTEQNGQSFNIRMVSAQGETRCENAHQAQITNLQLGQAGSKLLIFSSSLDGTIKGWDKTDNGFEMAGSQQFNQPVLSMAMFTPTYMIAGLQSGQMAGWDLNSGQLTPKDAHQAGITCMYIYEKDQVKVLISGDASGAVKVFECQGFTEQLQGQILNLNPNKQQMINSVKSITCVQRPDINVPLVMAGGSLGLLNLTMRDPQNNQVVSKTIGGHNEKTPNDCVFVFILPGSLDLCSVGAGGHCRLWTGSSQ